jgi:hypothetical protein
MRTSLAFVLLLLLASCSSPQAPATKLERASVLPLELNDNYQFRKIKLYFLNADPVPVTQSEPILFERRTLERADVTVRLEYRQSALSNYVMAMERYYPEARGSYRSDFNTAGDEYLEFGRVTSWRVLLIVDGRIVAFRQSFMWR